MINNLNFLDNMFESQDDKYKKQRYLKSSFEENLWSIELERSNSTINFDIELADGSKLISNMTLLNTIKYWILVNTLPENGVAYSDSATRYRIKYVLSMFDYINLHFGREIKISQYGFKLLNENHIKELIHSISKNRFKSETVYEISTKLKEYLLEKIKDPDLSTILNKNVFLSNNLSSTSLGLTEQQLGLVRAFLLKNNLYKNRKTGKMFPVLIPILKEIYTNKILTNSDSLSHSYPQELVVEVEWGQYKEKESIYSQSREVELLSETNIPMYKNTLSNLSRLNNYDFKKYDLLTPTNSIFDNIQYIKTETKPGKRFKTVPSHIVFNTIEKAINFHFKYGEDLIMSYRNIISFLKKNPQTNINKVLEQDVNGLLCGKLKRKVNCWSFYQRASEKGFNKFNEIRNGKSLYFLLITYLGATQFVTGALMARRQSEMISLKVNESVDYINKIIFFKRSKSTKGIFGVRDTIGLPIDEMALKMIQNIEEIQNILLENNFIKESTHIFTPLSYNNPFSLVKKLDEGNYNDNLDVFYDFVEVECEDNKRYYMRQHQLRRFFAMAFFWGNGFGSMDTLRWFLGHTDVQHLYHYITESTEGSVLKSVKAQYIYENLDNQADLKGLLIKEYGINNFSLIGREVLEDYIEELIEENKVEVEPEFFEDDNGKSYKILVKVKGK
jgi:hypothetical protein